jgi:hypothetical protein
LIITCDFCLCPKQKKHRWSKPSAAVYVLMYQVLSAALVQIIHITYTRVVLDEVDVVVLYTAAAAIEIAEQHSFTVR